MQYKRAQRTLLVHGLAPASPLIHKSTSTLPVESHMTVTANATVSIDELELGKTGNKTWFNVPFWT